MSLRSWTCGAVSAASLIAATASADPDTAPEAKPKPPAAVTPEAPPEAKPKPRIAGSPQAPTEALRRAAGAGVAAEGKQGDKPQAPGAQGAARAEGAQGEQEERTPRGKPEAVAHDHGQNHEAHGHSDAPPRAAIEAMMKARSMTEEQAIAHLRGGRDVAGADAAEAHRAEVRRERAKELRGRLKHRGIPNQLRAELRTHAKRLAQIERIRGLAGADAKLKARIDAVLARENDRHTRRMTRLIDEANQTPPAAGPSEAAPSEAAPNEPAPAVDAPKTPEQGTTP